MQVSVLGDSPSYLQALKALFHWAEYVDVACAWATAAEGHAEHWRAVSSRKIRRAVIGIQFAQTEPWVLRHLHEMGKLKIGHGGGTFHPKVFFGVRGTSVRAIVGSANLTGAAFSTNVELGVQLDGASAEKALSDLESFLRRQWENGKVVDDQWLAAYERACEASRRRLPPETPMLPGYTPELTSISSLQMSWDDYFQLLLNREGLENGVIRVFQPAPSYQIELELANEVFRRFPRLADVPHQQRKMLMGLRGASSGLLGSMNAAKQAKELVRDEPERVGEYLDKVPLKGRVSKALATDVVGGLISIPGVNVAVASRFLTVKRPDVFVSVNRGSKPMLATLLGRRVTKPEHYIDLLEAIWKFDWYKAPAPKPPKEQLAWKWRAALLDTVLYRTV